MDAELLPGVGPDIGLAMIAAVGTTVFVTGALKGVVGLGLSTGSVVVFSLLYGLESALCLLVAPTVATNLWQGAGGKHTRALIVRFWPALAAVATGVWAGTLNRLIGPGVFRNLLLGRYHSPTEEQRALLFIDLVGATAIAERIGAARFLALMNQFVYDIDAALEGSGGVIYRYVGDEAIITWRLDETRDLSSAVKVVFRLRARIAARGEEYRSRFGVAPDFRAALHAGPVVAGEMGDSKLEIVLLGDTANTAARIGQACRELDRAFLVSAEALALIELPSGAESERMPPAVLKGKSQQVGLYAINGTGPVEHDERRQRTPTPA